ncbi:hypothetical protein CF70_008370 [Cupriavidus sp. SK-3]|nr:hypothetical protein CF70_008370 [Cupriavidus sp. SK-3]
MGFSYQKFLIAREDTLWQLPAAKFQRMLRDPQNHCLIAFAGQRVRTADVVVELVAREPVRVVRTTFSILTFDTEGHLDPEAFEKQQFALAESVVAPVLPASADDRHQPVVDASARFIAQGGQWIPSRDLARVIDEAALGQRQCARLR